MGCARATNQTSKVENQIRKSLGLLILIAFRIAGRHDWQIIARRTTKTPLSLQSPQESRLGRKVQCSERAGALEGSGLQMTGGSLEKKLLKWPPVHRITGNEWRGFCLSRCNDQ